MTAPIPPDQPLNIQIRPGLPAAFEFRFYVPSDADDASSDPVPLDLTGYTPADLVLKNIASDVVTPAYDAPDDVTLAAALATQSGASLGVVQYTATATETYAINAEGWKRLAFSVVMADADGFSALWQSGIATVAPPTEIDESTPSVVSFQRFNVILKAGPSGTIAPVGVPVDLTTTGNTTLYTATADDTVLLGVSLRVTAVAAYADAPEVLFKRSGDGALFYYNESLTALDDTDEARNILFVGNVPTLAAGESLICEVVVAADADELTVQAGVRL